MVRHYWLVITFGAGLAVGVFIASLHPGSAGTVVVSTDAEPDTRPAPLAAQRARLSGSGHAALEAQKGVNDERF